MCDCHEHPLEHIIWEAIETYENAVPPLKIKNVFENMKIQVENWKADQDKSWYPSEWERK